MNLLIKKKGLSYEKVYPKTYIQGIVDETTGESLSNILDKFNALYLNYTGSKSSTRILVKKSKRRAGLWVSYVKYDGTVVIEYYQGNTFDDASWSKDSNWVTLNDLRPQDITIGSNGNWFIDGVDTGKTAIGSIEYPSLFILPTMHLYLTPASMTVEFEVNNTGHLVLERDLTEIINNL